MQKDKYGLTPSDEPHKRETHNSDDKPQHLLRAEEQILQAISARAPLPVILNAICCALDCQIGNMVSLISLPSDGRNKLGEIAFKADLFGLHIFHSAPIAGENVGELGLLEMFCCARRKATLGEHQLIERAVCLAAIAIKHYNDTGKNGSSHPWPRELELQWPGCVN
jgi:hypothetical protein